MYLKQIIGVVIVIIVGVILGFTPQGKQILNTANRYLHESACDRPIKYSLGVVDPQFHISQDEFAGDINEAAGIWKSIYGKPLFLFRTDGDLQISLVYDNRQSIRTQISQLENSLDTGKKNIDPQVTKYDHDVAQFKQRLNDHNNLIADWNNRGGAPPDEYAKITAEQISLKQEADRLNSEAARLNLTTREYNSQVTYLKQTVSEFNQAIEVRPEEGIYNPATDSIEIYFNINKEEMIHNLAHELGHAIGVEHVTDPKAIMYKYSTANTLASPQDVTAILAYCRDHSRLAVARRRIIVLWREILALPSKLNQALKTLRL